MCVISTHLDHEDLRIDRHNEHREPEDADDLINNSDRGAEDPWQRKQYFRRVGDVQEVDAGRLNQRGNGRSVWVSAA